MAWAAEGEFELVDCLSEVRLGLLREVPMGNQAREGSVEMVEAI